MNKLILNYSLIMLILSQHNIEGQMTANEMCFNDKGEFVKQGEQYFPLGSDICTQCTCLNGRPEMCISVLCSPPEKCRQYHTVTEKCCEFVCLDGDYTGQNNGMKVFNDTMMRGNGDNRSHGSVTTNNLGLRLIASTITSFLILALLLFMIHRLRQRRLLLMIRRLQTRRLEQVNGLSADNSNLGYLSAHDQYDFGGSFNEPPPPYTFWKPPENYIPPGEAPPPYDDSITGITVVPCFDMTNHTVNRVNITGNCIVGSLPTPFQQTQLISAGAQPTLCIGGQRWPPTLNQRMSPISMIDTISSDNCYEHITVVRINDSQNVVNNCNNSNNNNIINVNVVDNDNNTLVVQNNNTFNSDSTSTSSIASSGSSDEFNSPSNCSVMSSSSQSTPTQSTVRRIETDSISRL